MAAFFLKLRKFLAHQWFFYALLGSVHQTHKVVFLLFDGHLTVIFDATKLSQFLVLPIYIYIYIYLLSNVLHVQSAWSV